LPFPSKELSINVWFALITTFAQNANKQSIISIPC
jgi:hypothetical protein